MTEKESRLAEIIKLRNSGFTYKQIGEKFGISAPRVYEFIKCHNPELLKIKPKKRQARLAEMIKLRNNGFTYKQIGEKFGISESGVHHFVHRNPELLKE